MGQCNSLDIFQERMSKMFADIEWVWAYLDNLLCVTTGNWDDYLNKLEVVFKRLQAAGLKVNVKKSFFGKDSLKYLGYWVTQEGIQLLKSKVAVIHKSMYLKPKNSYVDLLV